MLIVAFSGILITSTFFQNLYAIHSAEISFVIAEIGSTNECTSSEENNTMNVQVSNDLFVFEPESLPPMALEPRTFKDVDISQYSAGFPIFAFIYFTVRFFSYGGLLYNSLGVVNGISFLYTLQQYLGLNYDIPHSERIVDYIAMILPVIRYQRLVFPSVTTVSFLRWLIVPLAWINEILVLLPDHYFVQIQDQLPFLPDKVILIIILYLQLLHYFIVDA